MADRGEVMNAVKDMPIRVEGEKPSEGYFLFNKIEQGKSGTIVFATEIEKLKRGDGTYYWKKGKGRAFDAKRCRVLCARCTTLVDRQRKPRRNCEECVAVIGQE
jgi:hypothetical protein